MNVDNLRAQVELQKHIALRDLPKRFIAVQFLVFCVWQSGNGWLALANLVWLVVTEAVELYLVKSHPEAKEISVGRIGFTLIWSSVVAIGYYVPGVVLTLQTDLGYFLGGFFWITGAMISGMYMYNSIPAFYLTTAVVGMPSILLASFWVSGHAIKPADGLTWLLPVSLAFLTIGNMLQLLWESRDTHRELKTTRARGLRTLRKLEKKTLHDELTGLPNRVAFKADFDKGLAQVDKQGGLGKLVVDLDGFKPINDLHGHVTGDRVLQAVADRLKSVCAKSAKPYRLGGDEFAVIALRMSTPELKTLAQDLLAAIKAPMMVEDKILSVGASIGIAQTERPDTDASALCEQADEAMYRAKSSGKDSVVVFDDTLGFSRMSAERRMELATALHTGQIAPVYQPKFTTADRQFVGLEALARWDHPDQGVLRPKDFLDDMQAAGLLPELTQVMVTQVLAHITLWRHAGMDPGHVSVNIPDMVLAHDSGCDALAHMLANTPEAAPYLAFELTEDIYTKRASASIGASISRFRAMGIPVYLDDFGTGHGSYQHLLALTPDQIKIDGVLVSQLAQDSPANAVVSGIIAIAHGLGAKAVAEMVETEAQWQLLCDMGCDFAEGYFLSPELSAQKVLDALAADGHHHDDPKRQAS